MNHRSALLAVVLFAVGCADASPLGPSPTPVLHRSVASDLSAAGPPSVTALTWNVYVGAEIERVLHAQTPYEIGRAHV